MMFEMTYDARTPVPGAGAIIAAAAFGRLGWLGEERIAYDALASSANRLLALLAERKIDHVVVGGLAWPNTWRPVTRSISIL